MGRLLLNLRMVPEDESREVYKDNDLLERMVAAGKLGKTRTTGTLRVRATSVRADGTAGPTCDSADIMYENYKYGLPLNLAIGDRMYWLSTGAYTTSYSAVEFNGFPPLASYYI